MSWGNIWKGVEKIELAEEPYIWKFYESLLNGYSFKGKKILEFGCGTGINSILMAKRGAKLTFLDYSKDSLKLVKQNLDKFGIDAELIHQDIFDFEPKGEFDLVHSEGLIEHFLGEKRQRIVDIHAESIKKGGKALIIVPHKKCLPYRIGKLLAEMTRTWIYVNEHPYGKPELIHRMKKSGLEPGPIRGGETLFSLFFLFAPLVLQSSKLIRSGLIAGANDLMTKLNYDNYIANRWGRVIGCVGEKI